MANLSHHHDLWISLLSWLRDKHGMKTDIDSLAVECRDAPGAGKGLFALKDCSPSSALFTVPARALINVKTIGSLYPPGPEGHELSPVQMISLHLFLHKPQEGGISNDPLFGPYLSTLPRDFSGHPCTWSVNERLLKNDGGLERSLLQSLPPCVRRSLQQLVSRLWADWETVRSYLRLKQEIIQNLKTSRRTSAESLFSESPDNSLVQDFLWAWLNVNTRCIHYRLDSSISSPKNMTLCPILDFANHTPSHSDIIPQLRASHSHALGGDYVFKSNSARTLRKNSEVFLRYGGHANRTLFIEYGFVNLWEEGSVERGEVSGEVDVQDLVEALFENGPGFIAKVVKQILEDEGYWGDWTIHSSPAPAHPSYRLITALRLYHHLKQNMATHLSDPVPIVDEWRKATLGETERISDQNEECWRNSVADICESVIQRAVDGTQAVKLLQNPHEDRIPDWSQWMQSILLLWQEELEVSRRVLYSIRSGEEF
ncbi:SET domain-containing protein [Cristinia sonorae]|uniref:SET domain-containing protein n=1 Tax=Cristinia sonorae TaxID=1940300 RepID=A0A8K0XNS7_9AGAR|nr:SET domain-containing protein [Cristinia sonorae]